MERLGEYDGRVLHCAENADNRIVTNMELARMVAGMAGGSMDIEPGPYEPGEMVDGKPISFGIGGDSPLWRPRYTLEEGMSRTLEWFRGNVSRYA